MSPSLLFILLKTIFLILNLILPNLIISPSFILYLFDLFFRVDDLLINHAVFRVGMSPDSLNSNLFGFISKLFLLYEILNNFCINLFAFISFLVNNISFDLRKI